MKKNIKKQLRPWRRTGEYKNCLICGRERYVPLNEIRSGRGKYCSRKCFEVSRLGKPMHPNTKKALEKLTIWNKGVRAKDYPKLQKALDAAHEAARGQVPWNKGVEWGSSAWLRKGNFNKYRNIHKKIYKLFGSPNKCRKCGKTGSNRQIHWANKNGRYLIKEEDWIRLCVKCHIAFDKSNKTRKELNL